MPDQLGKRGRSQNLDSLGNSRTQCATTSVAHRGAGGGSGGLGFVGVLWPTSVLISVGADTDGYYSVLVLLLLLLCVHVGSQRVEFLGSST